jgi:hypothetical protein
VKYCVKIKLFVYDKIAQRSSKRKCRRKFCRKHSDSTVPCKAMNYNIVTKLRSTATVLGIFRRSGTDWKKVDGIGARIEANPQCYYVLWFFLVGWQNVELTLTRSFWSYGLTKLRSFIAFCLQIENKENDTDGYFRNRYSKDFSTHNLRFILTGCDTL